MQELANIDWDKTLSHLVDFATSSEGKDQLKKTIPLLNKAEAENSFAIISEAQNISFAKLFQKRASQNT